MHTACLSGNDLFVEELIGIVDVNLKDNYGRTALHLAVTTNNIDSIKLIISTVQFDINAQTISGETALVKAIRFNKLDNFKLLLRFGADPTIPFSVIKHYNTILFDIIICFLYITYSNQNVYLIYTIYIIYILFSLYLNYFIIITLILFFKNGFIYETANSLVERQNLIDYYNLIQVYTAIKIKLSVLMLSYNQGQLNKENGNFISSLSSNTIRNLTHYAIP